MVSDLGHGASIMTSMPLSDDRKKNAHDLVQALSDEGITISAAFWILNSEIEEWRLILVSPDVQKVGYRKILLAVDNKIENLNGSASFSVFDLELRSEYDPYVIQWFNEVPALGQGSQIINSTFNEVYVPEAHFIVNKRRAITQE